MNDRDPVERELAPLTEMVWKRGHHFESLKRQLRRASPPAPPRRLALVGAVFLIGIASGLGAARVLPGWSVTLIGDDGPSEIVLTPLDGTSGAPTGTLRDESGDLYRVELIDGQLVMRKLSDD